jgi:hypothetical protein
VIFGSSIVQRLLQARAEGVIVTCGLPLIARD